MKIHVCSDEWRMHQVKSPLPSPPEPRGSILLLSQEVSGLADGNHLLPLLLEGLGDSEAAKKYYGPLAALADASPSATCPGAVDRFFLCAFLVHLLV